MGLKSSLPPFVSILLIAIALLSVLVAPSFAANPKWSFKADTSRIQSTPNTFTWIEIIFEPDDFWVGQISLQHTCTNTCTLDICKKNNDIRVKRIQVRTEVGKTCA